MPPKKKTPAAPAAKTRAAVRKGNLKEYTCFAYAHPDHVQPRDWKCPKCGHAVDDDKKPLDGGSRCCGDKKCGGTFHWCAFKDNFKGGYECDAGPFHMLEAPPPLEKWKRVKINPESGLERNAEFIQIVRSVTCRNRHLHHGDHCKLAATGKCAACNHDVCISCATQCCLNYEYPTCCFRVYCCDHRTAAEECKHGFREPERAHDHSSSTSGMSLLSESNPVYNCFDYKHAHRAARDDWKCPKCAAPPGPFGVMDGGSAICSGCGCHFHWCAFAGKCVHGDTPLHRLESPPSLEKEEKKSVADRDPAESRLKKTALRLLAMHTLRCLDYKSPARVDRGEWKCPRCGAPEDRDMMLKDGGSARCSKCAAVFHWCAFAGDYVCDESPYHVLDDPPALEKEEKKSVLTKKTKIESDE